MLKGLGVKPSKQLHKALSSKRLRIRLTCRPWRPPLKSRWRWVGLRKPTLRGRHSSEGARIRPRKGPRWSFLGLGASPAATSATLKASLRIQRAN